jgi:hypothetical protein
VDIIVVVVVVISMDEWQHRESVVPSLDVEWLESLREADGEARELDGGCDGGCECKTQTGTRVTGLRGYKEGRWFSVQGESASRVRGLSRHGISRPQRYPTRSIQRVQQTLFRGRHAANGASADHQGHQE